MTSRRPAVALVAVVLTTATVVGALALRGPTGTEPPAPTPQPTSISRPSTAPTKPAQRPVTGSGQHLTQAASGSASPAGPAQLPARLTAARALLEARASAVRTRDKQAWMATVDRSDAAFSARQADVFDNLMRLPVQGFGYDSVESGAALPATRAGALGPQAWAQAWVATVRGHYRLAGFDSADQAFDESLTLVRRGAGWRLAADTDGPGPMQIWDLPRLNVLRGRHTLVVGNAPMALLQDCLRQAEAGIRRVSAVWGDGWRRSAVLVVPATGKQFAGLLQRDADLGLDQVAAVTQGALTPGSPARGDRIVVSPTAFTKLQPLGLRVVLTHELTHVAVRSSTTRAVPTWLSEGFADYVGYGGVDLSRAQVAAPVLAEVRQGRGPKGLPSEADFDPGRTQIAPAYSAAWLACVRLADTYGQDRLVAYYRAVAGGLPEPPAVADAPDLVAARAFPQVFHVTEDAFVTSWLGYLRRLAGSDP